MQLTDGPVVTSGSVVDARNGERGEEEQRHGPPMTNMESTSAAGVISAAKTTMPTMLTRHALAIDRAESTPMKLRTTRKTGRTNAMPVAMTILNTKSK